MITQIYGKVVTPSAVVLVLERDGAQDTIQIPSTDARFDPILDWIKRSPGNLSLLAELLVPPIIPDIEKVAVPLQAKFAEAHFAKADTSALKRFNERLNTNPTASARQSLHGYVEKHGVTVDADGCLIFYKRVRKNLCAHWDSSFQYKVGAWQEVPRSRCVDQPTESCGFGLHVCPWKFLDGWYSDGVILEIVVPPENFTSVPPSSGKLLAYKVFTRRIVPEGQVPTSPIVETETSRAVSDPKLRREQRRAAKETGTTSTPAVAVTSAELKRRRVPCEILVAAGIQAGSENNVRIIATDPRSRFLLVTSLTNKALQGNAGGSIMKREHPFHETVGVVSQDDFGVAIPLAMFAAARIDGRSPYTARVLKPNLIEIRPA